MPQPLDVGAALTRVTTAVGERVLGARDASGLSSPQLQVLRVARDGTGMSELVERLGSPKSTVSSVVDQLATAGLVARTTDPDDRRRQIVMVTVEGAARLGAFDDDMRDRVAELLAALPPARRRRLSQLLARLPGPARPIPLL